MTSIVKENDGALVESVVVHGDLSKLAPEQRATYYVKVCESVGLNPLTKPFEYLRLNGREILYATRGATEQLRQLHGVSIAITDRQHVGDVYVVTAKATDKSGRTDESTGAVTIGEIRGDALANALMKAETKAKRRVTLSICGLGWLEESELETLPMQNQAIVEAVVKEGAIAEEQAARRLEGDKLADEFIKMIEGLDSEAAVDRFCYLNGYEMRIMHANAKARVWRQLTKAADKHGVTVQSMRNNIRDSPAPTEEAEEVQ